MLDEQFHDELRALRNLEKAVRAYGLTSKVVSAPQRMEMLALALKAVIEARKSAIRKSKLTPFGKPAER